ncbi:hypothetical protein HDU92_007282 [Lobulomyces angularis]|nr:hypothetical protein HDU92_007282 [Lobulomyces angularis]
MEIFNFLASQNYLIPIEIKPQLISPNKILLNEELTKEVELICSGTCEFSLPFSQQVFNPNILKFNDLGDNNNLTYNELNDPAFILSFDVQIKNETGLSLKRKRNENIKGIQQQRDENLDNLERNDQIIQEDTPCSAFKGNSHFFLNESKVLQIFQTKDLNTTAKYEFPPTIIFSFFSNFLFFYLDITNDRTQKNEKKSKKNLTKHIDSAYWENCASKLESVYEEVLQWMNIKKSQMPKANPQILNSTIFVKILAKDLRKEVATFSIKKTINYQMKEKSFFLERFHIENQKEFKMLNDLLYPFELNFDDSYIFLKNESVNLEYFKSKFLTIDNFLNFLELNWLNLMNFVKDFDEELIKSFNVKTSVTCKNLNDAQFQEMLKEKEKKDFFSIFLNIGSSMEMQNKLKNSVRLIQKELNLIGTKIKSRLETFLNEYETLICEYEKECDFEKKEDKKNKIDLEIKVLVSLLEHLYERDALIRSFIFSNF